MDVKNENELRACSVCQKEALHKCGGCRRIYYCSKQHQRQHWDVHKNSCIAFKRGNNGGVVAVRDIACGEIILEESPIIWGPSPNSIPSCLGCGKSADVKSYKSCGKCGWLVCSDLCSRTPSHLPECQYTVHYGKKAALKNFDNPLLIYQCVLVLRCLYQKQFIPKIWKKLERLERAGIEKSNKHRAVVNAIRRIFLLASVFSDEDIVKAFNIVMSSSFEVAQGDILLHAIYPTGSLFSHDCTSNCSKTFTKDGKIRVTSCKSIKSGDRLSLCYTNPLWGTPNRRCDLYEARLIKCECSRCGDPTEFGTFFSSLKCRAANCRGALLPHSFTDDKLSKWKCTKCEFSMSSYSAYDIIERIGHEFSDLNKADLEACKHFLKTYKEYLSDNHFYNCQVRYVVTQLLGADCTNEELDFKHELCQKVEDAVKILAPSDSEILQRVVEEKYAALNEKTRRIERQDP